MHFDNRFHEALFQRLYDHTFSNASVMNAMQSSLCANRDKFLCNQYLQWVRRARPYLAYSVTVLIADIMGRPEVIDDDGTVLAPAQPPRL